MKIHLLFIMDYYIPLVNILRLKANIYINNKPIQILPGSKLMYVVDIEGIELKNSHNKQILKENYLYL